MLQLKVTSTYSKSADPDFHKVIVNLNVQDTGLRSLEQLIAEHFELELSDG